MKQLLSVVLVPSQPGHPMPLAVQLMDQQAGKLHGLVKREMKREPAALQDLMSRLDLMGLLPMEAQREQELWPRISQIVDGNSELRMFLRVQTEEKELKEIPGARELLETMTMYQWLEALEAEVDGR
jgi:hypothetical protein